MIKISREQMMLAEKQKRLDAFDVSDPALPVDDVYARVAQRVVFNQLGESGIMESTNRAAFWTLLQDQTIPRHAQISVERVLSDPRRTEAAKMQAIHHILGA
jgi:hypothetical protein